MLAWVLMCGGTQVLATALRVLYMLEYGEHPVLGTALQVACFTFSGLVVIASIAGLSCLFMRRMRDAGLPTWLALLPNAPLTFPALFFLSPSSTPSKQDILLTCFAVLGLGCWVAAVLLTLVPSKARSTAEGDPVPG